MKPKGKTLCEVFMAERTWGGKRRNSGRKSAGRRAYLIRMKPKTHKALMRAAKPKSVGAWMDENVSQLSKLRDIANQ